MRKERTVNGKENCGGCKWLDQVKHYAPGEGYCCMVERSKDYKPGDKARYANMPRCELYEAGNFAARYRKEDGNAHNDCKMR